MARRGGRPKARLPRTGRCGGRICYHGSRQPLRIGAVLTPWKVPRDNAWIERAFEQYRPPDKPSRLTSWFLGGDDPNVIQTLGAPGRAHFYEVEPVGPVHQGDLSWYDMHVFGLQVMKRDKKLTEAQFDAEVAQAVAAYWASKPWEPPGRGRVGPRWEFHTPQIRVIREVFP